MAPSQQVLDVPLHKAGVRLRASWWPGGRLLRLAFGNRHATLDPRSAAALRDALNQYLEAQGAST
jgi:hypothetical protein